MILPVELEWIYIYIIFAMMLQTDTSNLRFRNLRCPGGHQREATDVSTLKKMFISRQQGGRKFETNAKLSVDQALRQRSF